MTSPLLARMEELEADLADVQKRVARVLAMHDKQPGIRVCVVCFVSAPCPTARALSGVAR